MWNGISVVGPSITYSPSARSIRRRACSRSTPCTISFEIIGSYAATTSRPSSTPESTRTPGPARLAVRRDARRRGQESARRVLGVDAALDRVPAQLDVLLRERERLAERDEHLLAHEVEPGDHLGDRVLHLDARVHLHEEVLAVLGEQTLDRSGGDVAGGARGVDADAADACAQLLVDGGRRRLFDELLMSPLDRAVAFAEMDDVAVRVREDLHLDVPRIDDELLDVHVGIREVRLALPARGLERALRIVRTGDLLHPLAAAARGRLDQQRIPDRLTEREQLLDRSDRLRRAGDDRHAGRLHRRARAGLLAHQLDRLGRGPDPHEARVEDGSREAGVLGEEAVAGVDCLCAGPQRRLDERVRLEVALHEEGLVRVVDVERPPVGLRVHGDGPRAELPQRPEDADGDLTAVGDQDLVEHQRAVLSPL